MLNVQSSASYTVLQTRYSSLRCQFLEVVGQKYIKTLATTPEPLVEFSLKLSYLIEGISSIGLLIMTNGRQFRFCQQWIGYMIQPLKMVTYIKFQISIAWRHRKNIRQNMNNLFKWDCRRLCRVCARPWLCLSLPASPYLRNGSESWSLVTLWKTQGSNVFESDLKIESTV